MGGCVALVSSPWCGGSRLKVGRVGRQQGNGRKSLKIRGSKVLCPNACRFITPGQTKDGMDFLGCARKGCFYMELTLVERVYKYTLRIG